MNDPSQSPPSEPYAPPAQRIYPGPTQDLPGATQGLVLGILSIVMSIPVLGLIMAILGYRASRDAKALNAANPGMFRNAGSADAGYVCSIVGMVIGGMTSFCACTYFGIIILSFLAAIGAAALPEPPGRND